MYLPWVPVQDRLCYGVVTCNLDYNGHPMVLSVRLGEPVLVKGELDNWFYVKRFEAEGEGIVPKGYVNIKDCTVIKNGEMDIVVPKQPTLSQEIVASLQEWNKIAKQLYVVSNERWVPKKESQDDATEALRKFMTLRKMILDLHACRKRLLTSNLTVEGLKELKKQVSEIIDAGNSLLKLDMVVRDELGNPLDPLSTSTIQLFREHLRASQKLRKNGKGLNRSSRLMAYNSHSLILTLNSIHWRVVDECEIRFFLCEMNNEDEPTQFTESVQINLKQGYSVKTPYKFLFTDLGKVDFERQKVYLVAYVTRIGGMDFKEEQRRDHHIPFSDKKSSSNVPVRRPYGVGAKEITHIFRAANNNLSSSSSGLKTKDETENDIQTLLYLPCTGEDTMEETLTKVVGTIKGDAANENTGSTKESSKAVGFVVRLAMVPGNPKQIQVEQPVLLRGNPTVARKMGFPEVILPNDTRNELYIKLIRGEFHRTAKSSNRNVEVTVSVHNDRGLLISGILSGGNGSGPPVDQYRSVVYYHNDKPKWNEHLKISLPMNIEDFSTCHVKFTFKHRSLNDSKDRSEKPFALAYLKLKEPEGTAIRDGHYELILYKIDPKHYRESEVQYLSLPSVKSPTWAGMSKPSCPTGFSSASKDYFYVTAILCSTNFTQNADLLQLLLWVTKLRQVAETTLKEQPDMLTDPEMLVRLLLDHLKQILEKVTKVSGEEIVKFLHPILDALFLILVDPIEQISTDLRSSVSTLLCLPSAVSCERYVFNCLLHIFGLMMDHKYQNFQSVLNLYVEENFSSTLAYRKLSKELKYSIEHDPPETVLRVMKTVQFFFRFIIKSFEIHKRLRFIEFGRCDQDCDDEEDGFERGIEGVFEGMCGLLKREDRKDPYIGAEGGCLKHLPTVIEDLIQVFPPRRLTEQLVQLTCVVPPHKLTNIKLTFISEIVHSELFIDVECRFLLLPTITHNIIAHLPGHDEEIRRRSLETMQKSDRLKKFFGEDHIGALNEAAFPTDPRSQKEGLHTEETEKCIELFGDVMDILHSQPDDFKTSHVWYIMQTLLRPIIFSIGTIATDDQIAVNMVAIFLSLLREMKNYHYGILINSLKEESVTAEDPYRHGLVKFLNDVLVVMKNLFHPSYFPSDWNTMVLLQNSIVLSALEHFATTIKAEFADPFEEQPWNNFFNCTICFLTQPSLQLEDFSQAKQNYIVQNFGDMRKRAAELIRVMWFSLGESKRIRFVPAMVGIFLDMAFVPETDLRKITIPVFFDMMHCEFDQDRPVKSFKEVEDELIRKIVEGLEGGKGDLGFRDIFYDTMTELCEHNNTGLKAQGLSMVSTITTLMDLLLQYREVEHEEDPGNRMSCIVNLLDFSKEINRKELYLRYLYKLHDLHVSSKNYTEAAFTLKLHSHQLEWSDDEVPSYLRVVDRHPSLITQSELKEALYNDIIAYFDSAKMWECALEICDELRQQYEESYTYAKLPKLHRQIADFYDKIMTVPRYKPEYFRVGFYGGGWPSFLQDKVFIYRGKPLDTLPDFEARMLGRYFQAELLRSLGPPSDEIRLSCKQYLQICKVDPVMSTTDTKRSSGMKYSDENILNYYKANEVDKFTYSRPYHQEPKDGENEFASLWLDRYYLWTSQFFPGIMGWFPIVRQTLKKMKPIENAIETLEMANESLKRLVLEQYQSPEKPLTDLSMKLNGILEAAVMGGVVNYERAFLNPTFLDKNPGDAAHVESLKRLICLQAPIIEECLKVHGRKCQDAMRPFHNRMEEVFKERLVHIEATYGPSAKFTKDEQLLKEIEKAFKKNEAKAKLLEPRDPQRHGDTPQTGPIGYRRSTVGRSVGSFASSINLYQNANANRTVGRSMASISQRSQIRRSTHSSFSGSIEGEAFTHGATLPRPGGGINISHSVGSSMSKLQQTSDIENNNSSSGTEHVVTLTQKLVTQRPPRNEYRNSWTNGSNRLSETSIASLDTLRPFQMSDPGSRNSPDSAIGDETPAPPLPPKQREREIVPSTQGAPPPPPPKKPVYRPIQD